MKKYFVDVVDDNCDVSQHEVIKIFLHTGNMLVHCKDFNYYIGFDTLINTEDIQEIQLYSHDVIEYLLNYKARIEDDIISKDEIDYYNFEVEDIIYSNNEEINFNIENYIVN